MTERNKAAQELSPRIYNPITDKYYPVRQKITSKGKAGQIKGLWSAKKHRVEVIKK